MVSNEVSLNGDLSLAKQTVSVPNQLLLLMTLILGVVNVEDCHLQH